MELQIKDLVDSIRHEGIEAAEREAAAIIDAAREKARSIIEDAEIAAQKKCEEVEKTTAILKQSVAVTAEQAKRDAVLAFKNEVSDIYRGILQDQVRKVMASESLERIICAAISDNDVSKLTVEVAQVSEGLKSALADKIKAGLEIKPVKDIDAGFRISDKDGSGYIECSDEEIAQMLMPFFGDLRI